MPDPILSGPIDTAILSVVGGGLVAVAIKVIEALLAQRAARQQQAHATQQTLLEVGQAREESVLDEAAAIRQELRQAERELRGQVAQLLTTNAELSAKVAYLDAQLRVQSEQTATERAEREHERQEAATERSRLQQLLSEERQARERLQQTYDRERAQWRDEMDMASARIAELERMVAVLRSATVA